AFGAVEDHPSHKVVGEAREAMLDASGDEERVARRKGSGLAIRRELATAADHDIDLVLLVWCLEVGLPWREDLQRHHAVRQHLGVPDAQWPLIGLREWKPRQRLGETDLHDSSCRRCSLWRSTTESGQKALA